MDNTPRLNLKKPAGLEYVNVADLNENSDKIDAAVGAVEEKVTTHEADKTTHVQTGEREKWNGKQDGLPAENRRKITFGTAPPTGGADGDIYFQYE